MISFFGGEDFYLFLGEDKTMKKCNVCLKKKIKSEFHKDKSRKDGLSNRCKICDNKKRSEYHQKNKEKMNLYRSKYRLKNLDSEQAREKQYSDRHKQYRIDNPHKIKAKNLADYAQKKGFIIKPDRCSKCDKNIKIEKHHPDYSKPLEVIWLCRSCHIKIHK